MGASINVPLLPEERQALLELARRTKRHPRHQAALLLRRELERRGLLEMDGGRRGRQEAQHD